MHRLLPFSVSCLVLLTAGVANAQAPGTSSEVEPEERRFGLRSLAPSFGAGLGGTTGSELSLHLWLGLQIHPLPGRLSPFVALGSSMNFISMESDRTRFNNIEFAPQLRVGVSLVPTPGGWLEQTFPSISLYGIAGMRTKNSLRESAARFGVGATWIGFARWQRGVLGGGRGKPPAIPWSLEYLRDTDEVKTQTVWASYQF